MIAGNVRFRTAVMQSMKDYQQAEDRTEKPFIVRAIISNTYSTGGCFLRRCETYRELSSPSENHNNSTWIELNFQEQKDKVRHALRDAIAEVKMKQMKSVECRRHQWSMQSNGRSTTAEVVSSTTNTTSSVDVDPVVSVSNTSNKVQIPTESGIGESSVLPFPSASMLLNALPNAPSAVIQHLLQTNNNIAPPPPTLWMGSGYAGNNRMLNRIGMNENESQRMVAMQLAAQQLQLVQMQSYNDMNLSIALQIYERQQFLQKEQYLIQNVQNCVAMNATKLATERDYLQLQVYLANLQNGPSQQSRLW